MRISDWSSDVCSSDLSGKCWPRRRFPKRIRECSHVASKAGETGLAARYALALFDLADERKALDQVAEDLTKVESAIAGSAALQRLVRNPVLSRAEQGKAMAALLKQMDARDRKSTRLNSSH